VQEAVGAYPVTSMALEQTTGRQFGPATPLIDLLKLPDKARGALQNIPAANMMPPRALVKEFLKLNRSSLGNAALKARKQELLELNTKLD